MDMAKEMASFAAVAMVVFVVIYLAMDYAQYNKEEWERHDAFCDEVEPQSINECEKNGGRWAEVPGVLSSDLSHCAYIVCEYPNGGGDVYYIEYKERGWPIRWSD